MFVNKKKSKFALFFRKNMRVMLRRLFRCLLLHEVALLGAPQHLEREWVDLLALREDLPEKIRPFVNRARGSGVASQEEVKRKEDIPYLSNPPQKPPSSKETPPAPADTQKEVAAHTAFSGRPFKQLIDELANFQTLDSGKPNDTSYTEEEFKQLTDYFKTFHKQLTEKGSLKELIHPEELVKKFSAYKNFLKTLNSAEKTAYDSVKESSPIECKFKKYIEKLCYQTYFSEKWDHFFSDLAEAPQRPGILAAGHRDIRKIIQTIKEYILISGLLILKSHDQEKWKNQFIAYSLNLSHIYEKFMVEALSLDDPLLDDQRKSLVAEKIHIYRSEKTLEQLFKLAELFKIITQFTQKQCDEVKGAANAIKEIDEKIEIMITDFLDQEELEKDLPTSDVANYFIQFFSMLDHLTQFLNDPLAKKSAEMAGADDINSHIRMYQRLKPFLQRTGRVNLDRCDSIIRDYETREEIRRKKTLKKPTQEERLEKIRLRSEDLTSMFRDSNTTLTTTLESSMEQEKAGNAKQARSSWEKLAKELFEWLKKNQNKSCEHIRKNILDELVATIDSTPPAKILVLFLQLQVLDETRHLGSKKISGKDIRDFAGNIRDHCYTKNAQDLRIEALYYVIATTVSEKQDEYNATIVSAAGIETSAAAKAGRWLFTGKKYPNNAFSGPSQKFFTLLAKEATLKYQKGSSIGGQSFEKTFEILSVLYEAIQHITDFSSESKIREQILSSLFGNENPPTPTRLELFKKYLDFSQPKGWENDARSLLNVCEAVTQPENSGKPWAKAAAHHLLTGVENHSFWRSWFPPNRNKLMSWKFSKTQLNFDYRPSSFFKVPIRLGVNPRSFLTPLLKLETSTDMACRLLENKLVRSEFIQYPQTLVELLLHYKTNNINTENLEKTILAWRFLPLFSSLKQSLSSWVSWIKAVEVQTRDENFEKQKLIYTKLEAQCSDFLSNITGEAAPEPAPEPVPETVPAPVPEPEPAPEPAPEATLDSETNDPEEEKKSLRNTKSPQAGIESALTGTGSASFWQNPKSQQPPSSEPPTPTANYEADSLNL